MGREEFFHAGLTRVMRGIEIGPSYRPLCPKRAGWNVVVADHAGKEDLIRKYNSWQVDTSSIEDVDVVLGDRGLADIQPKEHYDYIVASHVIEHVPDPIGFLHEAASLLKPRGHLRLAVPDKRFCFDLLKPVSTTGQLLQAFSEKRTRHSLAQFIDALMLHVTRNGEILFPDLSSGDKLCFAHPATEAYRMAVEIVSSGQPFDVHGWVFTPASFSGICDQLAAIGSLPFRIVRIVADDQHEFLVDAVRDDQPVAEDVAAITMKFLEAYQQQARCLDG